MQQPPSTKATPLQKLSKASSRLFRDGFPYSVGCINGLVVLTAPRFLPGGEAPAWFWLVLPSREISPYPFFGSIYACPRHTSVVCETCLNSFHMPSKNSDALGGPYLHIPCLSMPPEGTYRVHVSLLFPPVCPCAPSPPSVSRCMSMCSLPAAGQLVAKGRHSVIVRLNLTLYTALSGARQSARTECSIWGGGVLN